MTEVIFKTSLLILIWLVIIWLVMNINSKIKENAMEKEFQRNLQKHLDKIGGKRDDDKRDDR